MKVLVVDENRQMVEVLQQQTESLELLWFVASSVEDATSLARNEACEIILMRDFIAGQPTCHAIQELRDNPVLPEIVIYSERGDTEQAENALESGAWDYVVANDLETILPDMLQRVCRYRSNKKLEREDAQLEMRTQLRHHGIIGSSAPMQNCLNLVAKFSQSDASVLITGETGTGKELFASAIHNISPRRRRNLTIIDCAALPSTLVESILFGHAKGSFTGADRAQKGLVKQADGGTLFLDEIGEMPLEIQKKLLRVLQEQKYLPVGSNTTERSDFRLVAATNRDLHEMVKKGEFREDLLYRLKTFQLELPSLRSRRSDIPELTYYFRNSYCRKNKRKRKKLATDYLMTLNQYDWPGNVRELFLAIEYSITDAHQSSILEAAHLPVNIRLSVTKQKLKKREAKRDSDAVADLPDSIASMPTLKDDREQAIRKQEKRYLKKLLELSGGNIKTCCETAGLSRSRLYDLLKKHALSQSKTTLFSEEE